MIWEMSCCLSRKLISASSHSTCWEWSELEHLPESVFVRWEDPSDAARDRAESNLFIGEEVTAILCFENTHHVPSNKTETGGTCPQWKGNSQVRFRSKSPHYYASLFREVKHPFIVSLVWSFKDSHCLYMLFPFISGGELFSHLRWLDLKITFYKNKIFQTIRKVLGSHSSVLCSGDSVSSGVSPHPQHHLQRSQTWKPTHWQSREYSSHHWKYRL